MRLFDRAAQYQAGQQHQRAEQWPAALPVPDLDAGAGVPVDFPGEVIDAAGIGGGGLGQPRQRERLAAGGVGRASAAARRIWRLSVRATT